MLCNTNKPPFDDINFRKAIAYGDRPRQHRQRRVLRPGPSGDRPGPARSWWYDEKADHVVRYDPDKAREYLAKSKYPNGAEFDINVPATPYLLDMKDAAVVVQAQLQQLGIKPNIKLLEPNVVVAAYIRGEHTSTMANIMSPGEADLPHHGQLHARPGDDADVELLEPAHRQADDADLRRERTRPS